VQAGATTVDELLRVVEPPVAGARPARSPDEPGAAAATTSVAPSSVRGALLLLSDVPNDESAGASALRAGLERAGQVVRYATPSNALTAVRGAALVAVIVVASSGTTDALPLLRALRREPAARRLPIVIIAPGVDDEAEALLFREGATDVVARLGPVALPARLQAILARA
jgi:CheY-like chemotaxis protein